MTIESQLSALTTATTELLQEVQTKKAVLDNAVIAVAEAVPVVMRNIGPSPTAPTVRSNGGALQAGDYYFNTVSNATFVYSGGVWGMVTGATAADLANATDPAKGAALLGDKGTSVSSSLALDLRRPRKMFSKMFAAASGPATLKVVTLGDSLAGAKIQQILASLDRRMGGLLPNTVNTAGSAVGNFDAGADLQQAALVSAAVETAMYQYWPTGTVLRIDAGGSVDYKLSGANPTFTTLTVYYVKEPGAGTVNLLVNGVQQATASAAGAAGLGVLTYTQALATMPVRVTVTGASVRILFAHRVQGVSGVDAYQTMNQGGLLLANATSSAQGRAIWQATMASIAPDLVTFEMDDEFGDGAGNDAAFTYLSGILDAACPYADKLIIGSTPRSNNDAGKLTSRNYLKNFCGNKNASYLFFDSYYLMGSYAEMNAIFGTDDGTHPTAAAQAYAAEILWNFLGLNGFNLGYTPRAVNDPGTPSRLAQGTTLGYRADRQLKLNTDASFGYDWTFAFPRTLSFTNAAGVVNWQFSANTAVNPHVMPISVDFTSAGNVRKLDTSMSSGIEFTRYRKTDNPGGGFMHLQTGLIRSGFTRSELLAIPANQVIGAIAYCTDCTGGAQWVYAKGVNSTDWATVDGKAAI